MRYIIEKIPGNIHIIFEGKRLEKNLYTNEDKQSSKYIYRLIYFCGSTLSKPQDLDIHIDRRDPITLTKHYNSFEEFVQDHLELFL